ncbi:MAG: hypothetical protein KH704_12460, partial [Clostridiales bacterium]|nr:hypothetical protein [Clostridiales bacterium]
GLSAWKEREEVYNVIYIRKHGAIRGIACLLPQSGAVIVLGVPPTAFIGYHPFLSNCWTIFERPVNNM